MKNKTERIFSQRSGILPGPQLWNRPDLDLVKLKLKYSKSCSKSSIPISRGGKMMNQAEFLYNLGLCKSKTLFHGRNAQLLKVRKESSTAKRV